MLQVSRTTWLVSPAGSVGPSPITRGGAEWRKRPDGGGDEPDAEAATVEPVGGGQSHVSDGCRRCGGALAGPRRPCTRSRPFIVHVASPAARQTLMAELGSQGPFNEDAISGFGDVAECSRAGFCVVL